MLADVLLPILTAIGIGVCPHIVRTLAWLYKQEPTMTRDQKVFALLMYVLGLMTGLLILLLQC
jgi:hypothetical protein